MLIWLTLACAFEAAPIPSATPILSEPAPSAVQAAPASGKAHPTSAATPLQAAMVNRPLEITRHGACRMECRGVDEAEARLVLRTGQLDPSRTRTDGQCPSHAFEGQGTDGHRLRVVFAECPDETKLVTAIDLDQDWPCACD